MHYFQQRYLREVSAFPAMAGLLTVDLPNKGFLSGIELRVWGIPLGVTTLPDFWLHDYITRVEVIVNGSQVVKSYDARQLLAMMLYKKTPHYAHDMKNIAAVSAEEFFYINFGRHYHDLDFQLDLGRVNDPELRITYNFNMTTPLVVEGWSNGQALTAAPSYSVICHLLRDEPTPPRGYIKTAEIARHDNGANNIFNLNVPRGPVYSNLYLQSWWQANGLGNVLEHYEVNINSDDVIPIRTRVTELIAENVRMYGLMEMTQQFYGVGMQNYPWPLEVGSHNGEEFIGIANSDFFHADLWGCAQPIPLRGVVLGGIAPGDNPLMRLTTRGALPFAMAAIPLFDPWDEKTQINTAELGDFWVRVEETPGAAAGVMKLLGDEVVTTYL